MSSARIPPNPLSHKKPSQFRPSRWYSRSSARSPVGGVIASGGRAALIRCTDVCQARTWASTTPSESNSSHSVTLCEPALTRPDSNSPSACASSINSRNRRNSGVSSAK